MVSAAAPRVCVFSPQTALRLSDYQRQMPYALFFPDLVKNTMTTGWKKTQQADGVRDGAPCVDSLFPSR